MASFKQAILLFLLAVSVRTEPGPDDEGPDDDLTVVTFSMGEENEDMDDPTKQWFTGIYDVKMITMVRVEYYEKDGYKHIRCIGFSHGKSTNNCPDVPDATNKVDDIVLERDEYITEVSGDDSYVVTSIYFKTNKGSIGPYGLETDPTKHTFHASNDGKPLLYVQGYSGVWVYSMHFSFHYKGVLELDQKVNEVAKKTYECLKGDVDDIFKINDNYKRMLPDVARIGCYAFDDNPSTPGAAQACDLQVLLNQINILASASANLQRHGPRNLLELKDFDSSKYLDKVGEAKAFHDLLTGIRFDLNTVINVTHQQSTELNRYFTTIADFDKQIAQQDLIYIQGLIETKTKESHETSKVMETRMDRMFGVSISCAVTEVIDKAFRLGTVVAAQMNPLNLLINGPDMSAIYKALDDLWKAIGTLTQLSTLAALLDNFVDLTKDIANGFAENEAQMKAMEKILDVLANETDVDVIEAQSESFIKLYGDYTPQVSTQQIARAITLLDGMANEVCSIMADMGGLCMDVVGTIYDAASHDCVYISSDIAVLNTLFEDVHSLQFEAIDAMTAIVKGSIAYAVGGRIGSIQTILDVSTAAVGTAMLETSYQAASLARCDILEYLWAGFRHDICKKLLFKSDDIQKVISFTGSAASSRRKVFAYLPTTQQDDIVIPFVNLTKIVRGEYQRLRLPIGKKQWLKDHQWISQKDEPQSAYFVHGIEMYIPSIKCNESDSTPVQIVVEALSANPTKFYAESAPPDYTADKHLVQFEYLDPGAWCVDDLLDIPVADNDNLHVRNLSTVCPISRGIITPTVKDDFTFPSLFTTWTFSVTSASGCTLVEDEHRFNFQPMVTVIADINQVFVKKEDSDPGMDYCWPEGSRCSEGYRCKNGEMDFTCEKN